MELALASPALSSCWAKGSTHAARKRARAERLQGSSRRQRLSGNFGDGDCLRRGARAAAALGLWESSLGKPQLLPERRGKAAAAAPALPPTAPRVSRSCALPAAPCSAWPAAGFVPPPSNPPRSLRAGELLLAPLAEGRLGLPRHLGPAPPPISVLQSPSVPVALLRTPDSGACSALGSFSKCHRALMCPGRLPLLTVPSPWARLAFQEVLLSYVCCDTCLTETVGLPPLLSRNVGVLVADRNLVRSYWRSFPSPRYPLVPTGVSLCWALLPLH